MLLLKSHSNLEVSGFLSNIRIFLEMYLAKTLHPSPLTFPPEFPVFIGVSEEKNEGQRGLCVFYFKEALY